MLPGHHRGLPEGRAFLSLPLPLPHGYGSVERSETRKVSQELAGCWTPESFLDEQEQKREWAGAKGGWEPVPVPPLGGA